MAERLGMTRHQLDEVMPVAELAEWAALDELRHREAERARRQHGRRR